MQFSGAGSLGAGKQGTRELPLRSARADPQKQSRVVFYL